MKTFKKIVLRIFLFLLIFLLGFASCLGALTWGGYYAYSNVTLNKAVEWGLVKVDTSAYLDENAQMPVADLTIQQLVAQLSEIRSNSDQYSLGELITRYGIILPKNVEKLLPPSAKELSVKTLLSSGGIDSLLQTTNMDYVFAILPENMISPALQEALGEKSLHLITEGNYKELLSGVPLGRLTGVKYTRDAVSGSYRVLYANPDAPTAMELLADIDLGVVYSAIAQGGDLLAELRLAAGDVALSALLAGAVSPKTAALFEGKTLADVILLDETSNTYKTELTALLGNVKVGALMGYTAQYDAQQTLVGWKNGEATLTGIDLTIANIDIGRLLNDPDYKIKDELEGLYLGELMGYTPCTEAEELTGWVDAQGNPVQVINQAVANIRISDFLSGEGFDVSTAFSDIYLGDVLSYHKGNPLPSEDPDAPIEYEWYQDAEMTTKVNNVTGILANYILGDVISGNASFNIEDTVKTMKVSDLLGFTQKPLPLFVGDEPLRDELGLPITREAWYDAAGNPVNGTLAALAGMTIDSIKDGLDNLYIKDVAGYYDHQDKWYSIAVAGDGEEKYYLLTPATGVLTSIADLSITDIQNGETVDAKIKGITLAEIFGYEQVDGNWQDKNGAPVEGIMATLAPKTIGELDGDVLNNITISEAMGYREIEGVLCDKNNLPVTGLFAAIASTKIGELDQKINTLQLGEILGWEWTTDGWQNADGSPVTGLMLHFADCNITNLKNQETVEGIIGGIQIGEALGWEQTTEGWQNADSTPVKGLMLSFAGYTIADLKNSETVEEIIGGIKIGEALGWELVGGVWQDSAGQPIGGIMLSFADHTIADLKNNETVEEIIGGIQIGEALGWELIGGVWQDSAGQPIGGIMLSFADLTISDMSDPDAVSTAVGKIQLGDALGWTKDGEIWKDNAGNKVEGIMRLLADVPVSGLNGRINEITIGEVMGWTKVDGVWQDESTPATGIMLSFADLTIAQMSDSDAVSNAVGDIRAGDALGYEQRDGGKYYYTATNEQVTGFLALIDPDTPVGKLSTTVNERFEKTTMGDYVENGIIHIADSTQTKLNFISPNWRNQTIQEFIDGILNAITVTPLPPIS